jgi:hypothetical protein
VRGSWAEEDNRGRKRGRGGESLSKGGAYENNCTQLLRNKTKNGYDNSMIHIAGPMNMSLSFGSSCEGASTARP